MGRDEIQGLHTKLRTLSQQRDALQGNLLSDGSSHRRLQSTVAELNQEVVVCRPTLFGCFWVRAYASNQDEKDLKLRVFVPGYLIRAHFLVQAVESDTCLMRRLACKRSNTGRRIRNAVRHNSNLASVSTQSAGHGYHGAIPHLPKSAIVHIFGQGRSQILLLCSMGQTIRRAQSHERRKEHVGKFSAHTSALSIVT